MALPLAPVQGRGLRAGGNGVVRQPRAVVCMSTAPKMERSLMGEDFGARDPFAGEVETNFGDKSFGHFNTEHIIKPPDTIKECVGLTSRSCQDNQGMLRLLTPQEVELLRQQTPGWKVSQTAGGRQCIRHDWKAKDFASAVKIVSLVAAVAEREQHHPDLHISNSVDVAAELSTATHGGLTENDFIVASKVNELKLQDLQPKKKARFWA